MVKGNLFIKLVNLFKNLCKIILVFYNIYYRVCLWFFKDIGDGENLNSWK